MASVPSTVMEIPKLLPLQRILVIADNRATQDKLPQLFQSEGYGVEITSRGVEVQKLLRDALPSALVLDLQMVEACPQRVFEEIRKVNPSVPIIVLGASSSVMERILCLKQGADDYVVKPLNGKELLPSVRAVMRGPQRYCADFFAFGDVQVDFCKMEVRRQGMLVPVTAQEFRVLKFMIQHSEHVLSREELLNKVWGYRHYPTTRTVDNHIWRLRKKLERQPSDPVHFLTIHRMGYKFVPHCQG